MRGLHLSAESNTHNFAQLVFLVGSWKVTSTFAFGGKGSWIEALDYEMPSFARAKLGRFTERECNGPPRQFDAMPFREAGTARPSLASNHHAAV